MKGYYTHGTYMGWIDGTYKPFETIEAYVTAYRESEERSDSDG